MPETRDVVIIGAGHNGLVTAFYLAKAGFKPLVLERSARPSAAAPSLKNFIPASAARGWLTAAGPISLTLSKTWIWRSMG